MKHMFPNYTKQQLAQIFLLLFLLSFASGYFTFNGLSVIAVSFAEYGDATVFAIASSVGIFLFWSVVWAVVPRLHTLWTRICAYICVFCYLVLIFFLSSSFNVAGLSGGDGLELHLELHVTKIEMQVDEANAKSLLIRGVASDLRGQSSGYEDKAESELLYGAYSGSPGKGSVYFALLGIKTRVDGLLSEVTAFESDAAAHSAKARALLETIRSILVSDAPYRERMAAIARHSDDLRRTIAAMDASVLAQSVDRALSTLPREIDLYTNYSANRRVAAKQKAALDKVRLDVAETVKVLGAFVDEVAAEPSVTLAAFERITPTQSVFRYWTNFIPHFAGGIALDLMPLAVLIFASIATGSMTRGERVRGEIEGLSVADLMRAIAALAALRGTAPPSHLKPGMEFDVFGPASDGDDDSGSDN